MRMSQLSETTGVSVASIKFYMREGLLPAGERSSATQAEYDDSHVDRLRLIRALLEIGGLSVATAQQVLAAVDTTGMPLSHVFGVAQYAISDQSLYEPLEGRTAGVEKVDALVEQRGWVVSDDNPGRRGAARVLDTYDQLGQNDIAQFLPRYADAAEVVARADLASVALRSEVSEMAEVVVIGTILGDALNAALRRMAQEHVSYELFPAPRGTEPGRDS